MPDQETGKGSQSQDTTLVVRRIIQATPERLFKAWTDPEQLKKYEVLVARRDSLRRTRGAKHGAR